VKRKLKLFENKTQKYRRAWEKLSGESEETLEEILIPANDTRILLKALVNPV